MDSNTSRATTAPIWPLSYQGIGFLIVPQDDGTYQGIVQGGYHTPLCFTARQALALVRDYIIQLQGGH